MKRFLCVLWAAALLTLCLTGCGGDPNLISDAEQVVSRVMDMAEDITASGTPDAVLPVPTAAVWQPLPEEPVPGAPAGEAAPDRRPGRFTGSDGSVLTVAEDGACTYETVVSGTVNGEEASGPVVFHGTAENGRITFVKITYYGLDITALAAAAGYSDLTAWEAAAESIWGG